MQVHTCACIALELIVAKLIYNKDLSEKLNCNSIFHHIIYQQTYLQLGTDRFWETIQITMSFHF